MDLETWTRVLGLEAMEVVEARSGEGGRGWRLAVIPTSGTALCPDCHKPTSSRHMVRWQSVRDLPIAGQDVLLEIQTPQLSCGDCGKVFTVHPTCALEGTHVTLRLAEALTDCVNVSTLSAAAATYHLPESTVKAVFEKVVERRRAEKLRSLKPISKLGVDEIHLGARDGPRPPPDKPSGSLPPSESTPSAESGEKKIGRG